MRSLVLDDSSGVSGLHPKKLNNHGNVSGKWFKTNIICGALPPLWTANMPKAQKITSLPSLRSTPVPAIGTRDEENARCITPQIIK